MSYVVRSVVTYVVMPVTVQSIRRTTILRGIPHYIIQISWCFYVSFPPLFILRPSTNETTRHLLTKYDVISFNCRAFVKCYINYWRNNEIYSLIGYRRCAHRYNSTLPFVAGELAYFITSPSKINKNTGRHLKIARQVHKSATIALLHFFSNLLLVCIKIVQSSNIATFMHVVIGPCWNGDWHFDRNDKRTYKAWRWFRSKGNINWFMRCFCWVAFKL